MEALYDNGVFYVYQQFVSSTVSFQGLTSDYSWYTNYNYIGNYLLFIATYDESDSPVLKISPQNSFTYYIWGHWSGTSLTGNGSYASIPSELVPYEPVDDPNTYIFQEGFENGDAEGWSLFDADGDGYFWYIATGQVPHSGDYALWSRSWTSDDGALTPDNYAISPAIELTSDNYLSFWVKADTGDDGSYCAEHYAVYIWDEAPSSETLGAGSLLLEETYSTTPTSEYCIGDDGEDYQLYVVPIPAGYNGQTVYIGFRHFNCEDQNYLAIDDVSIIEGTPVFSAPARPKRAAAAPKMIRGREQRTAVLSLRPIPAGRVVDSSLRAR